MNYDNIFWWVSLLGSIASLFGLPIAIFQIFKTRRVIIENTKKAIQNNILLSDISNSTMILEQIKSLVREKEYKFAQARISDVLSQLLQIQESLRASNSIYRTDFKQCHRRLSIIQSDFEKKINDDSAKISRRLINAQISIVSGELNKLIGEAKMTIERGD